jgi:acyl transferase domain-containing protein
MESAGLRLEDMKGSNTSVFAGQFTDDVRSILQEDPDLSVKYKPIGTSAAILAARVSWFYDLRGSSFTLDTACSSSIVALHTGAQDLRAGLSDMVSDHVPNLLSNHGGQYQGTSTTKTGPLADPLATANSP